MQRSQGNTYMQHQKNDLFHNKIVDRIKKQQQISNDKYNNNKKYQNQNFGLFSADCRFRAEGKKDTSRVELKILQLKLWLEPAWIGLITTIHLSSNKNVY